MRVGAYGILEPTGPLFTDYDSIDLAVVPGVAFTRDGVRLGRGKGYYDRLLPRIKSPKVGICFPFQILESIPTEPFDVKMDEVVAG
jgi:5-formyltetrahydrofolate cyclo-ligase